MCCQEDSYHHDSCKWCCTSTEMTLSSSGGYVWPKPDLPQVVVSPPRALTPPHAPSLLPQAPLPVAPMEVDDDWPLLPPPDEPNQHNATTPWLPIIPMHMVLGECDTVYPMLHRGFHQSRVDNTVHAEAVAKAAQQNEALGIVLPCTTMRPSDHGFPQTVADWEGLLRSACKKGNINALHLARAFVTQAQNMPAVRHTEPQHQVLKEWTYPMWFQLPTHKGKERAVPKPVGCQVSASPGQHSSRSPKHAATSALELLCCLFLDLPLPHEDGWQPHHELEVQISMPMMQDMHEMWAEWIDQHLDKCLRGIVVMPDSCMSMCGICGMQLIKQCNP